MLWGGVEVVATPGARQGNDSVNIRGLSGNRVAMDIDGIDLSESQETRVWSSQGIVFGRGSFVETSALSAIDVDRASGGNSLGGRVTMKTISTDELLNGKTYGGHLETAWNGVDKSKMYSAAVAMQRGAWKGMLLGTLRKGHETKNMGTVAGTGSTRTKPDPLNYNSRYLLTKQEIALNEHHSLTVTGEYLDRKQWGNGLSKISSSRSASYYDYYTRDEVERKRVSLMHQYNNVANPYVQSIETQLYWQQSSTNSYMYANGNFTSSYYLNNNYRTQSGIYTDKVWGLSTIWKSSFDNQYFHHDWRYGAKFAYHDLSMDWLSNYIYLQSGLSGTAVTKPFADSKRKDLNLFVDGQLYFTNNLILEMGLDLYYYHITLSQDGYRRSANEGEMRDISKFALTPRIGLAWRINPSFIPYVQYARGFKAPSNQQLTNSFHTMHNYYFVGNPNLRPETSHQFELGVKGKNKTVTYALSAYSNYYRNLIDLEQIAGTIMEYQYTNLNRAHIYGGEAKLNWHFLDNWVLKGSLAYARGTKDNGSDKTPLNSVMPFKVKLGVAYATDTWGTNVDITHSASKKMKDIDGTYSPYKRYTVVDLGAYFKPSKHLSIHAGVNNLFNQKYWNWADLSYLIPDGNSGTGGDLTLSATNADRYTAPGRTFNVGIRYTF